MDENGYIKGLLNELIQDIISWNEFFLVFDDESGGLVMLFYMELNKLNLPPHLIKLNLPPHLISPVEEDEKAINNDDCVLVICKSGEEEYNIDFVNYARLAGAKVYLISQNKNSSLAQLSDEKIIIDESFDFERAIAGILFYIVDSLKTVLGVEDDIRDAHSGAIR